MKYCNNCKKWKSKDSFCKNKHRKDGLQDWCKECTRKASKKQRMIHGYNGKKREFLYIHKHPCEKCGEKRLYLIQFHHIDPNTKKFNPSAYKYHSEKTLINEIKKCVCLCSNCHDEFHHFYGQKPLNPIASLEEYLSKKIIEKERVNHG